MGDNGDSNHIAEWQEGFLNSWQVALPEKSSSRTLSGRFCRFPGLKPAGRGSLLTACGYTHIHGNLTGVWGLGGAFQQKEGEIGGQGLGTQPPNHRSDLATMIRGMVGQMLHEVR